MSLHLVCIGVSHRTARLELRERVALPDAEAARLVEALQAEGAVAGAFALSTCNRTEVYVASEDAALAEDAVVRGLARRAGAWVGEVRSHAYVFVDGEAARHLFAVASGLESMVLGEAQILGQLRRAHERAAAAGATGPVLDRLVRDALSAGRRVRERTAIGRAGVSVSSAAVEIARTEIGDLADRRVLVLGAGKSGELTAQALADRGVSVVLASRREEQARCVARRFGQAVPIDELSAELERSDVILTATSAPHHVITRDELETALSRRDGRPLLIIDLAVPRDVDPSARGLPGLTLYDLDDVQRRADDNARAREAEAGRAEELAADEAARYERWRSAYGATATVAALRRRADAIVDDLLRDNDSRWEGTTDADRERIALLARAVASRLLDEPTRRLKAAAGDDAALETARELFGLGEAEPTRRVA